MKKTLTSFIIKTVWLRSIFLLLLNLLLLPAFGQTVTITGTPQETANVSPGYRNRVLYIFQADVAGGTATLNGITGLTTSGNYLTSDITLSGTSRGFRVHYFSQAGANNTPSFQNNINTLENVTAGNVVSTVVPSSTGTGQTLNATFNSSLSLPEGRHWLFITADIAAGAAIGRTVGLNSFTQANFVFANTPSVAPVNFPATGLQTFRNATISLSAAVPAAASVERGISQLQLYRVDITATGASTQLGDGNSGAILAFTLDGTVLGTGTAHFNNFRTVFSEDQLLDPIDQQMSNAINTPSVASPTINSNSLPIGIREGKTRSIFVTTNTQSGATLGTTVRVVSVAANLPAGTTFAAGAGPASLPGGGMQTIASGAAQVTLEGIRTQATQLLQGTSDNLLGTVKVSVTGGTTGLYRISVNVPGTFSPGDYTALKLWASDSEIFDPATAVLLNTWRTGVSPNALLNYEMPGISQISNPIRYFAYFTPGTTRYIYFTADIAPNAVVGRTLGMSYNATNASNTTIPGSRTVITPAEPIPTIAVNPQIGVSSPLPAALNLPRGANDQLLYQMNLAVANADASFAGIRIPVTTTDYNDITGGYRLYYSNLDFLDISTARQVGTAVAAASNQQTLSFTAAQPVLISGGSSGYLFLVANTSAGAALGNTVAVSPPALNEIIFLKGVKTGALTKATSTISGPPQIALAVSPLPSENIAVGTKNVVLYGLNLSTSVANADFTGIALRTAAAGTGTGDATNYRLYFSTDQTFDAITDKQVGAAIAGTGAAQTLVFNSAVPVRLSNGSTRTLFLVADIGANAIIGNKISIQAPDAAQVRFVLGEATGTAAAGPQKTISVPPAIALSSPAPAVVNTPAGTADVVLYRAEVAVSGVYANFTGLRFATTATFRASDINGGYRLYYSAGNTFNPATAVQVGKIVPSITAPQRLEFAPALPIRINPGSTGSFFLVANISPYASTGSQIGVEAVQLNDVLFESANKSGAPNAGNSITVGAALAGNFPYPVTGPSSLSCAGQTLPGKVLNITLPPFNADPTGVADATAAFNLALSRNNSFVYVPNGTYRFADSITWNPNISLETAPKRGRGGLNIIMWGESREGVILKLDDNAPGFSDPGKPKPFVFTGEDSPDRFGNSIHNVTINTGSGNAGTIGLRHYCNNYGGLYNVTIKSGDGNGLVGLEKGHSRANGPNLTKDVLVDGFNIGIRTDFAIESEVYEHITLRTQKVAGFYNLRQVLSIRDLRVENCAGEAMVNESGHVVLLDSKLGGTGPWAVRNGATAKMLVRNLVTSGYNGAITDPQSPVAATRVTEWTSDAPVSLFATPSPTTLGLPVNETPTVPWDDPATWVNVEAFGATPGGVCNVTDPCRPCDDDAPRIQAAIDATLPGGSRAGATTLFIPGDYRIMSTVRIRGSIRRIIGAGGSMGAPYNGLHTQTNVPVPTLFIVESGSSPVIVLENFTMGGSTTNGCAGCLGVTHFENNSGRTLVFRNTTLGSCTFNGGEVYFESVSGSRDGLFTFNNANVWARQFDPERDAAKIIVNGGTFWALGLKTEGHAEIVIARNNARIEVFGAYVYSLSDSRNEPMFVVENSDASINFFEYTGRWGIPYLELVKETQNGQTLILDRGAPSLPYPAPQPVTPPTYPATWSQRNDGTNPDMDGMVGSNLVLYVSSTGNIVNAAPQFVLSQTTVETLENAGSKTVKNFATGMGDGNPHLTQELTFEAEADKKELFEELPAIDAITGTLTYKPKPGAFGVVTVTVVLKDNGSNEMPNQNTSAPQTFTIDIKPVNDAPALNTIAGLSLPFNAGAQNVSLTGIGSGSGFETQTLTISAVSSNPALIAPSVTYLSPEATGTLVLTPATTLAGTAVITVTVTDDGGTANGGVNQTTRQFTVTVAKGSQTINFAQLADYPFESGPFELTATASSGLPVSYSILSGPATVSGTMLTPTGIGPVTIRATQAGDQHYLAAAPVSQTFSVVTSERDRGVKPVLECVTDNRNGTFTARFGYKNDMGMTVYIAAGASNYVTPQQAVALPEMFETGDVRSVISLTFPSRGSASWSIAGPDGKIRTATATRSAVRCAAGARVAAAGSGAESGEPTEGQVYPNPASGKVFVRVNAEREQRANVKLVSNLSVVAFEEGFALQAGNNVLEIAVQNLPSGVYTLQVYKYDRVITHKVVIRR